MHYSWIVYFIESSTKNHHTYRFREPFATEVSYVKKVTEKGRGGKIRIMAIT